MRTADVLIQSGHEGRTSGATGAAANGLREIELTPRVANAATDILKTSGLSVLHDPAITSAASVKVAVAFHFDGPPQAGSQFLYDDATDKPLADALRDAWSAHFNGKWLADNTSPLADSTGFSRYYGFSHWNTTDGEVVMELDTIGDPQRAALWKQPGYPEWAGRVIGAAIARRLGVGISDPGPYGQPGTPIIGPPSATRQQALQLWRTRFAAESKWDEQTVNRIIVAYWTLGPSETVNPAVGFAQSLKETGGFSFLTANNEPPASGYSPEQWNFAGIGTTGAGVPGERWDTLEAGVRGHLRRLRMYAAGTTALHDRDILKRSLPKSHWGVSPTVEELGGVIPGTTRTRWAPSPEYGESIVLHYLQPLGDVRVPTDVWADRETWPAYQKAAIEKMIARGAFIGSILPDGRVALNPGSPLSRGDHAVTLDRLGLIGP